MNKTVTVNIGGMVFHIEELAYEKLKRYLEAIRGYFTTSEGRDEIIQDIESRIAEMFSERIGTSRQVVTEPDVEYVIDKMGRPEQVAGEDENSEGPKPFEPVPNFRSYRKLYRDPDDKVIGGVCSGISHYIGIDPLWLRLAFAIALFVYGSGVLLYLLLLIIVPKAKTTAEKLEMKGRPVTIDSIKQTIEDEVEDIKSRISGKPGSQRFRSSGGGAISRFFELLGEIIVNVVKVFVKILGALLMIALFGILVMLFMTFLGMTGFIGNMHIPVFITSVFLEPGQLNLVMLTLALVVGIPLLALLFRLIRATFNLKGEYKMLNYATGILFTIGVILGFWMAVNISREFRVRESERVNIPLAETGKDTLYLDLTHPRSMRDESYYEGNFEIQDGFSFNDLKDTLRIDNVKLDVVRSLSDKFELVKISSSNGPTRKDAENNLRAIQYEIIQIDSVLKVSENFTLPQNIRFRNQKVQLLLKVPVGKSIHLGNETDQVIYDIQNTTNTYDGDMVGLTWTMTDKGLECIGCNLDRSGNKKDHVSIRINGEKIDVNSSEDTIDWDNKDVKVHINEDGVVIDAKERR